MSGQIEEENNATNVYRNGQGGHRNSSYRHFVMRYTVIDGRGSVSFVGPCTGLKALVAGCAAGPLSFEELMRAVGSYDPDLRDYVLGGLHSFDEHNVPGEYDAIHQQLSAEQKERHKTPVFRVVDEVTRRASLEPVKAGLILFNLKTQRIVQVQNTYADIMREDRGRIRKSGHPTGTFYSYQLPATWQIVP